MMPKDEAPEKSKKKRGPGRPKQDTHYASFTITMPPDDLDRLNEQVAATGRSRSELLRTAWNDKPITMRHEPALDEHYDQLMKLSTDLFQIKEMGLLGLIAQNQVEHILSQVDQEMAEMSRHRN